MDAIRTRALSLVLLALVAACDDTATNPRQAQGIRRLDAPAHMISHDYPGIMLPTGIANDGLTTLYISTASSGIFLVDMATNMVTGPQPSSPNPRDVVWAWGRGLLYSDEGHFVEQQQLGTITREPLTWAGGGIAHWRDSLYIGARDSDSIVVMTWSVFPFPRSIVRRFATPTRNEGLVADSTETVPSTATLWSVNQTDGWLTEIDLTGNVIRRCDTPYRPSRFGIGGVTLLRDTFLLVYPADGDPLNGTRITRISRDELNCALPDSIDIDPGSARNRINMRSGARIEVAAITTPGRDATTINLATARFGPANAEPERFTYQDVDRDGDLDAVFFFRIRETGISCGDTSAQLFAFRFSGSVFNASDAIVTTGCRP